MPRLWSEAGPGEPWSTRTECLLEPEDATTVRVQVRFLHVQSKTVEEVDVEAGTFREVGALPVDGSELVPWDEATEQEVTVEAPLARLLQGELATSFERPGGRRVEPVHTADGKLTGRTVRRRWPVMGTVKLSALRLDGPYGLVRLRLVVENASAWQDPRADRAIALRRSLVAAHSLIGIDQGVFLSLLDPPEWAKPFAEACANLHTWPVLIGDEGRRDAMLSSPIILYDHPTIAPESPGDLFDATEIDEILTLRTMALTEAEKREARATDERAAAIIDRVDNMPPELLERLHGAVRYLRGVEGEEAEDVDAPVEATPDPGAPAEGTADLGSPAEGTADLGSPVGGPLIGRVAGPEGGGERLSTAPPGATADPPELVPWWDPGADRTVSPETDGVVVAGVPVAKGSRVRLRPGQRRADAQDMFLAGREATVEAVFLDVDGNRHLAVTLDEDPAADLQRWHGRYLYFSPDEVEPK
ncbi:MAG TPA: hypothetical protein VHM23_22465 [Actinomycetota bacterium]|nr:hypothetical protein [Actinomycetota bacterium]